MRHIIHGYRFMTGLGYTDSAQICLHILSLIKISVPIMGKMTAQRRKQPLLRRF